MNKASVFSTERTRRKPLLCAVLVFTLLLLCSMTFLLPKSANSDAASDTRAIYLGMDKNTRGIWYDRNSAPSDEIPNSFNCNRIYGKDGGFMILQKITGDGQSFPISESDLQDLTPESRANWVEYPSYVTGFTSNGKKSYWNYNEEYSHGTVSRGALLSPDPEKWNRKDVWQNANDELFLTATVTDDNWHKVSMYVQDCSGGSGGRASWSHSLRILTPQKDTVLAEVVCNDYDAGIWYSFAIKGSFVLSVKALPGTTYGCISAMFFDPIAQPGSTEEAAINKADFVGDCEKPRTVHLSWTNKKTLAVTTIYRKEKSKPDSDYELLATLGGAAVSYTDNTARVSKTYTYLIGGGVPNGKYGNTVDYIVPSLTCEVETAQYALTSVAFDSEFYTMSGVDDTLDVTVTVKKNVKYDENDRITEAGEPYADKEVIFSIDGELAYDTASLETKPNMKIELGRVTTNSSGEAKFTFDPEYAGEYSLIATIEQWGNPADGGETGLDGRETSVNVRIPIFGYSGLPVLHSLSDAIAPGETFTIMGTRLTPGASMKVAIAPNKGTVDPAGFSESAEGLTYLEPTFTDANYDSGIMLKLPSDFEPGLYDIWVSNDKGWSKGMTLNAARPLFISQKAAYAGLEIEVVGRNFFLDEFGCSESERNDIRVMLKNGSVEKVMIPKLGVRYTAEESVTGVAIDESNPYRLTFVVPDGLAAGVYDVYVANDGENYRKIATPQQLEIVEKKGGDANAALFGADSGYDPLDLGVYWAQDLKYDRAYYMYTDESGSDSIDDTQEIKRKIDALANNGGGVLFFEPGTYYVSEIIMKDNVMLVGSGREETKIMVRLTGQAGYFIRNGASNNGIANLTIGVDLEKGRSIPDMFMNFADNGDTSGNVDARIHSNVFVKNVFLDVPYDVPDPFNGGSGDNRGIGIVINGKENFIIDDCHFKGYFAVLHRGFVNEYVSLRNNIFEIQRDVMHCLASYTFVENTALLGNNNDGHGWSARSDCYFGNNMISKVGLVYPKANNNGEIIMLEVPGAQINYGKVLGTSDDGRFVTIDREVGKATDGEKTVLDYNHFAIVITDGTGVGQLRYIERVPIKKGDDGTDGLDDKFFYGNTFRLRDNQTDWSIKPDQTSWYTIYVPIEHATIYRNKAENCAKSILLYSQCHDSLVAENDLKNTDGISLYSTIQMSGVKGTNIYARIERNTVDGVSVMTFKGGIGVMTERWTVGNAYGGMLAGAVSIRYNTVKNLPGRDSYVNMSEIPATPGIYVHTKGTPNVVDTPGDISFTIVEGNYVENCCYGVYIDNRAYNTVITNNVFKKIEAPEFITNIGAQGIRITSSPTFDLQGGSMTGAKDEYLLNSLLPKATRDGYYFWGWSETPVPYKGTEAVRFATASSGTLYAVWTTSEDEDPRIDPTDPDGDNNGDNNGGNTGEPVAPPKKGCGKGCKSSASVGGAAGVIAVVSLGAALLLVRRKKKITK